MDLDLAPHKTDPSRQSVSNLVDRVGFAVSVETDDENDRLRKSVMTISVLLVCVGGAVWVVAYAAIGALQSAAIPLTYVVLSLINVAYLYWAKHYRFFLVSQLLLLLLLPFLLQWSMGGFVPSGAVMLWAVLTPVGALMFHGPRASTGWFLAFVALTLVSVVIDQSLESAVPDITALQIAASFAFNILMISLILFLLLRYFVGATAAAKRRSDELLSSILPDAIAERLKRGERPIADRLEAVSVVFADVVGFTSLSESLEPESLVDLLDRIFDEFDSLADQIGLEKIKTVGDAYIVVAGLPTPRSDHIHAAAEMALAMRDHLNQVETPDDVGRIEMRFGIHCGPVVAGVIGTKKLAYSLWGDTVNIASRMESQGRPNSIHVSEPIQRSLVDQYEFDARGTMDIKGKGPMETYFLTERLGT